VRLGRLLWTGALGTALLVAAPGGAAAAPSAESSTDASTVEIRELRVEVERDLASQFGGRVDAAVRFQVVNTGDDAIAPIASIQLESQIGGGTSSAPLALGAIAPGADVDVTRTAGSLLPFGSAHVTVTVRADDGVTTATASRAVIPWLLLVLVAAVAMIAIAGRRMLRRRVSR
jgi:hypothetical protein